MFEIEYYSNGQIPPKYLKITLGKHCIQYSSIPMRSYSIQQKAQTLVHIYEAARDNLSN